MTIAETLQMICDEADHAINTEADQPEEVMYANLQSIKKLANLALATLELERKRRWLY